MVKAWLHVVLWTLLYAPAVAGQRPAGDSGTTVAKLARANEALERADYPEALKLLVVLAAENPRDAEILYDLAFTQDALDQTTNAEGSYRLAIAAGPGVAEPRVALGLLLARAGRAGEAHTELAAAVELPGASAGLKARGLRALARLDLKANPAQANVELLEALKLSAETADDTLMAAEMAESAKDPAEAERAYRRILATKPNDPGAAASLAGLLGHTKPAEAEAMLTAALAEHAGDAALTAQLAALYAAEGKIAEALPLAEGLHAANPGDANVTRLLAHLYARAEEPAKAEPLYAGLLAGKADAGLMDDRGEALIHLRRFAEAETLLQAAVRDPAAFPTREDYGLAAAHLAFAAANNNDPRTTLQALRLRDTVLPPSPSALFLEATAHDKLQEFKQAADGYGRFLAAANGKFPDEEFEARRRLVALQKRK